MPRPALYAAPKVEDFRPLDLAWLRRTGARVPGYAGKVNWSYRGVKATLSYRVERSGLVVSYLQGEQAEVVEFLPICSTITPFGGRRHWFSCPGCKRRCRIVYGAQRFRCRLCLGAHYQSQYNDRAMTIAARRWRLRQQLEEKSGISWDFSLDHGLPPKPVRMRWATYHRLQALDRRLEHQWVGLIDAWLQRTDPCLKHRHRLARLRLREGDALIAEGTNMESSTPQAPGLGRRSMLASHKARRI